MHLQHQHAGQQAAWADNMLPKKLPTPTTMQNNSMQSPFPQTAPAAPSVGQACSQRQQGRLIVVDASARLQQRSMLQRHKGIRGKACLCCCLLQQLRRLVKWLCSVDRQEVHRPSQLQVSSTNCIHAPTTALQGGWDKGRKAMLLA
jgi:hypothetical protein